MDWVGAAGKFVGGLAGGIGEGIGKVAGKVADWVPSPGQYRRKRIRELTNQMLELQSRFPFDTVKYQRMLDERTRLEREAIDAGQ